MVDAVVANAVVASTVIGEHGLRWPPAGSSWPEPDGGGAGADRTVAGAPRRGGNGAGASHACARASLDWLLDDPGANSIHAHEPASFAP